MEDLDEDEEIQKAIALSMAEANVIFFLLLLLIIFFF